MQFIDLILHLDKYLAMVVSNYNGYVYLIIFLVIFCETGLVVTPFLPGDSLLFIAGGLAATGSINFLVLAFIIFMAAFCGDNCNFFIGKFIGDKLFANPNSKIFRKDILNKTHEFYERHGRKTIIMARFVPLIRTFAPFVAGLGHMPYSRFITFSIFASILWVAILLGGGYLFGNIPFIKEHLSLVILAILIISILPAIKIVFDEFKRIRLSK
ncbi:MAG: DedA family protein [Neisseriaceae bacterium]|jgi:membrane-associated protein